jgi:hypothetical protein
MRNGIMWKDWNERRKPAALVLQPHHPIQNLRSYSVNAVLVIAVL